MCDRSEFGALLCWTLLRVGFLRVASLASVSLRVVPLIIYPEATVLRLLLRYLLGSAGVMVGLLLNLTVTLVEFCWLTDCWEFHKWLELAREGIRDCDSLSWYSTELFPYWTDIRGCRLCRYWPINPFKEGKELSRLESSSFLCSGMFTKLELDRKFKVYFGIQFIWFDWVLTSCEYIVGLFWNERSGTREWSWGWPKPNEYTSRGLAEAI